MHSPLSLPGVEEPEGVSISLWAGGDVEAGLRGADQVGGTLLPCWTRPPFTQGRSSHKEPPGQLLPGPSSHRNKHRAVQNRFPTPPITLPVLHLSKSRNPLLKTHIRNSNFLYQRA